MFDLHIHRTSFHVGEIAYFFVHFLRQSQHSGAFVCCHRWHLPNSICNHYISFRKKNLLSY
nr:MAG TPA: hypothetical protein [Caudoviricetes sp.]